MDVKETKCGKCGIKTCDLYWTNKDGTATKKPRCRDCYERSFTRHTDMGDEDYFERIGGGFHYKPKPVSDEEGLPEAEDFLS